MCSHTQQNKSNEATSEQLLFIFNTELVAIDLALDIIITNTQKLSSIETPCQSVLTKDKPINYKTSK